MSLLRRSADRVAARAQKRAQRATRAAVTGLANARRAVLQLAGLSGFTVAAWSVDYKLGLAIGSVCAFVLVWLLDDDA